MSEKTKICTKCKLPLPISKFHKATREKDGLSGWCRDCWRESKNNRHRKYPWKITLQGIKYRCNNKKSKRYKYYGGREIKCFITCEEIKKLWIRDNAHLMKNPSIDRENKDGDYIYSNCRYIELVENCAKDKRKVVLQYDLNGVFIKEWISQADVGRKLKIHQSSISACCRNERKKAGGFVWKLKEL